MSPRRLSWLFLLLAPLTAPGNAWADEARGPRLVVENKSLSFGEIVYGKQVKLTVPIWNRGDEVLHLKEVKPSCGCTVASFPERLAPGEEGQIGLVFNSSERAPGPQSFRIEIYSNDPSQRDKGASCTVLSLRGEVRSLYKLAPNGAYFGEFVRGLKTVRKTVQVFGHAQARQGFKAELKTKLPEYLRVEYEPLPTNHSRRGLRVVVSLLPSAPFGNLDHPIEFSTNIPEQPTFRMDVIALVSQRITGPTGVHFGPVSRAEGANRLAALGRRDGLSGIPIARIHYDRSLLKIETKEISSQRTDVVFKVLAGARPGPFAKLVYFFLDDPHQNLVTVPVYGRVEARVRVEPPLMLLPNTAAKGSRVGLFILRGVDPAQIKGIGIEPKLPSLRVVRRGLQVELLAREAITRWPPLRLKIRTTIPGEERILIPLLRPQQK